MIFINVKENEKEEKSTARTVGFRKFYTGNLMGHIIYCGKNLN